ncbi:MAG: hypothetical protein U5K27_18785 [Desulfotignum sp.]|nr:hypothetical protein [Desulfotignum sp.]
MESPLKKNWIKEIHIGPRQILFGLEMDDVRLTDLVLSCIARQCMTDGQARLHTVIEELTTENKLQAFDILQLIFGFVHELKVGFYHHNQPMTAPETKKALINDPGTDIRIILNKQVPAALFHAVQQVFQSMNPPLAENSDQHAFAFAVLNRIRQWHTDLQTWYARSLTDEYPGVGRIRELLALTALLLENQTAHALLTNCHAQRVPLAAAAHDIQKITDFYTKDLAFWDQVKQALPGFRENLGDIEKKRDVAAAYHELTYIFTASDPFDRISKARELFNTVNTCHQQIEALKLEACRQQAREQIDGVIRKLTPQLSAHPIDPDTQNAILLTLRRTRKKISGLPDIAQVNQVCRDTIDLTLDQVAELTGIDLDI